MDIGEAVKALKASNKVARSGWNGKNMYLAYQPGMQHKMLDPTGNPLNEIARFLPYVIMRTADGSFVPWLCSQTDLLAEDWEIVL